MTARRAPTCKLIRSDITYEGKQGLSYFAGISAETTGAEGLCMTVLDLPPGAKAKPHLHANHETAIYVISGSGEMLYGEDLSERMRFKAGDFIYIPAGMPHLPFNDNENDHCVAVLARTDPNEQESVVLLPDAESQTN